MSKSISLNDRTKGPWTNFELFLLKEENCHVGWVEWTKNSPSFNLRKNPFSKTLKSPFTYVVPEEISIPEEGLIRVNVGEIVKIPKISEDSLYGEYSQFYIVEGYESLKSDELPKPYLKKDDFLYKLAANWIGEENKNFGKELAINILSCPKSIYGIGGIGAQSFAPFGSIKELKSLNSSIKNLLPQDFLGQNKIYQYKSLQTKEDSERAKYEINKKSSDEISYNYLFDLSPETERFAMPTQIPILIPEGSYKKDEWGLDRDVFDYHMTALLLTPAVEENMQKKLTEVVEKTGKTILRKANLETKIDNSGILRLANAWCRLEFKNYLVEDDFDKIKNDFEGIFSEYFDFVEDVQRLGRTHLVPLTQMQDKMNLTIYAKKIYKGIKNLARDDKNKRISRNSIRVNISQKEISDYEFDRGLEELVRSNYLLQFKNYAEFLIVSYEDRSF